MKKITLQIHCEDQSGIIAAVTNFIANNNGNIVYIDQHVDREQNIFSCDWKVNLTPFLWKHLKQILKMF